MEYISPNYNERTLPVSLLVMHYTGMRSGGEALARLCDADSQVSAHYVVEEDGTVFSLVAEEHRAWHAGRGFWRGITDVNSASIGIEIVNPGHEFGYRPFPQPQMDAVLELSKAILSRHAIAPRDVIGHADLAPARKEDPGELFPWAWLAEHGVGLWPDELSGVSYQASVGDGILGHEAQSVDCASPERGEAASPFKSPEGLLRDNQITNQRKLAKYGYGIEPSGVWDEASQAVVRAFQRHFRQEKVDGLWDEDCSNRLDKLLEKL